MAYRYEKNQNGEQDLVIDGWEKGIADSPYLGIGNMRNVNIKYYPGVAYGNYKRLPASLNWGTFTCTGTLSMGATSATLTAVWPYTTGIYSTTFSNGDVKNVTFTNGSLTIAWVASGGLSSGATATIIVAGGIMAKSTYSCKSPAGLIYFIDDLGQVWKQNSVNSSTFNTLSGSPTTGAGGQGIAFWNNYLVVFRASYIDFCGDGTGDAGVVSGNWNTSGTNTPIGNITNMVFTAPVAIGDTSATISTYTDAGGTNRSNNWFGFLGSYQLVLSSGEKIFATVSSADTTKFSFALPAGIGGTATGNHINALLGTTHMSLVSVNDNILYFCNSNNVGSMFVPTGKTFAQTDTASLQFSYSALAFPTTETAIWLTELINKLMVLGNYEIYPWDRISLQWQNPIPIPEQGFKIINVMNNLYVFGGFKGNIYLCNGYSVAPFKKIPDYITGSIDPQWQWGGIMVHRQNLYFQALAFNSQTNNQIIAGIFSLALVSGNGVTAEVAGAITMENQNSFGLVQSSTSAGGCLVDNNTSGVQFDNYYSAWSSGVGDLGGIDYNSNTLYSNNEMVIETDIIPVGTAAQQKTFSSAEFKMDQPMQSGDSITLYARQSLSDNFVQVGTTSTAVLSSFYEGMSFQEWQWVQFKVTMSCNSSASSSSFNRLREIRIR